MKKLMTSIPGYCVYQYLLVINPNEEVRSQVVSIKKEFAEKYKAENAFHTKPHIALVKFLAYEMTQDRVLNRLGTIAMGLSPFKVELYGFGSYPSHTIYANVTTRLPIQQVVKELKAATQLMTLNKDNKPHFIEDSHFTICQKLKPWQFENGWLEYSNRHFTARFIADSMVLLKRREGEKEYQSIMRFEFQNLRISTKQGNLFM